MKLQATIVISYRADSFGGAGDALDDVLQRARERDDVEIDGIQLGTPASAGPVSIPYVERPPAPPQRVPHPLPNGERNRSPLQLANDDEHPARSQRCRFARQAAPTDGSFAPGR
jgi:hypothetical protein